MNFMSNSRFDGDDFHHQKQTYRARRYMRAYSSGEFIFSRTYSRVSQRPWQIRSVLWDRLNFSRSFMSVKITTSNIGVYISVRYRTESGGNSVLPLHLYLIYHTDVHVPAPPRTKSAPSSAAGVKIKPWDRPSAPKPTGLPDRRPSTLEVLRIIDPQRVHYYPFATKVGEKPVVIHDDLILVDSIPVLPVSYVETETVVSTKKVGQAKRKVRDAKRAEKGTVVLQTAVYEPILNGTQFNNLIKEMMKLYPKGKFLDRFKEKDLVRYLNREEAYVQYELHTHILQVWAVKCGKFKNFLRLYEAKYGPLWVHNACVGISSTGIDPAKNYTAPPLKWRQD
jgi:hypothetical protein